jgi:tetratricopeptide (TPR) repeat protein
MQNANFKLGIVICICCTLLNGCAAVKLPKPTGDIHPKRHRQHGDAVRQFEQRRDVAQYQAAMACWRMGDVVGCRGALEELARRSPCHLETRLALVDLYLFIDDHEGARLQAEQAAALAPQDARACHALGQALEAMGDFAGAGTQYERAIALDDKNEIYHLNLENLTAAAVASRPTSPKAVEPARPVAVVPSSGPGAVVSDSAPATVPAGKSAAISATPNTAAFAVAQAVQALQSNQHELSIRIVRDGIERFGDDAALYRTLGTAQYRQGDYPAAQVALRKAVSLDKSHPLSYFLLSATLRKLGEEEEAARCFSQAADLDPSLAAWR